MSRVRGIEIEAHHWGHPDVVSYVLVRIDIGKMPPKRVRDYIKRARETLSVFKVLDQRGIMYDCVGVRDTGEQVKVTTSDDAKPSEPVAELNEINTEADLAYFRKKFGNNDPKTKLLEEADTIYKGARLQSAHEEMKAPNNFAEAMEVVNKLKE